MLKLIKKEFSLCVHQTCILFMLLSAMMLIPSYPLYVVFFYTSLGIFFTCMTGRENNDIFYTLLLPVKKTDAVRGRIYAMVILELIQMALAAGFTALRAALGIGANAAGMDANIAFFGLSFVLLGLFNLLFFPMYYSNPYKVGRAFALSSAAVFIYILAAEACSFAVPFVRDRLDTPDPQFIAEKLALLAAGALVFALFTALALGRSKKRFAERDL